MTRKVFDELDSSGQGFIDSAMLREGLLRLHMPASPQVVHEIMVAADGDRDGKLSYHDFKRFVNEREAKVHAVFTLLDRQGDGYIDADGVAHGLSMLGITASRDGVEELMRRTKQLQRSESFGLVWTEAAQSGAHEGEETRINYNTFRTMLVLLPSTSLRSVFNYWAKATQMTNAGIDFDGDAKFSQDSFQGRALNTLVAGGIAGMVSRTATAPIDRLKLLIQTDHASKRQFTGILQGLRQIYYEGTTHRAGPGSKQ